MYFRNMPAFTQYKATKRLAELAKDPFDLTKPGNLTPERIASYYGESCGFKLLYGTERIIEEVVDVLKELVLESQALDKMRMMQQGEIMNLSENRAVLHTALRDFFENPINTKASQKAKKETEKLRIFLKKIGDRFTDLVIIGIGGSQLGPKANYVALQHLNKNNKRVHYISNVDPDNAASVFRDLDPKKTLVAVVSKSGTTLETTTNECIARSHAEHFISVTGEGSPIDDKNRYLECFHIWDWVGGRFSLSSMVGGLPIAFAYGFDTFWEFLRGANAMDKAALNEDIHQNIPLLASLIAIWNHNFLKYPTQVLVPYSQALACYPAHVQQVEMESNGKRVDRYGNSVDFQTGQIVWGECGTNAQHSFFQLIHQGTEVVPLELIGFKESRYQADLECDGTTSQQKLLSNLFAQALALATGKMDDNPNKVFPGNRPSHMILGKCLIPYALGALSSFFEHKVAFQGFIWDINSFDQEGVQLGKVLANKILKLFAGKENDYPLGDAFLKHLEML